MNRLKRYENYKDSGVEWLGMIPKEWGRTKLKNLVKTKITDGPHETPEFIDAKSRLSNIKSQIANDFTN